ncbi:MAG: M23 family metallopeptidase [Prevotellaceae bacterium]|jgi:hypothetical protein|nr:M23 family metallopeptidase [Prevotellaceae bacterium]
MGEKKGKLRFKSLKINDKYHLGIFNDTTYEQIFYIRLNGRSVVITVAVSVFILIALTTVLIAFTPIKELIPGYPDREMRKTMQRNIFMIDSMENTIAEWNFYLDNSIKILSGNIPQIIQSPSDSTYKSKPFVDSRSKADSLFRQQIEREEQLNVNSNGINSGNKELWNMNLMTPLKGEIVSKFDIGTEHFGIDIVSTPNAVVTAIYDGTVIMSDRTVEPDNIIQIQHDNNLMSVYKHNAKLLKKQGSRVKAGDAIAIAGNSEESNSSSSLHLEIWYRGTPVNPEQYIVF